MLDITDGLTILVDKPYTWTSFDVVNKIRWNLKKKLGVKNVKVGHAGTLDPLATGLLILCLGKHTKLIEGLTNDTKTYTGTFLIGKTTPSFDLETAFEEVFETGHIDSELLEKVRVSFWVFSINFLRFILPNKLTASVLTNLQGLEKRLKCAKYKLKSSTLQLMQRASLKLILKLLVARARTYGVLRMISGSVYFLEPRLLPCAGHNLVAFKSKMQKALTNGLHLSIRTRCISPDSSSRA